MYGDTCLPGPRVPRVRHTDHALGRVLRQPGVGGPGALHPDAGRVVRLLPRPHCLHREATDSDDHTQPGRLGPGNKTDHPQLSITIVCH